jgi:hypothetical protein
MPPQSDEGDFTMQYLLMLYVNESGWTKLSRAEQEHGVAAYTAYTEALTKAGILKGANRLLPSASATTVRTTNGKTQVLDGPYVDSKEQLGGYYLIDAPDLDAALSWAARCPAVGHGVVEVRPLWGTSA